MRNRLNSAKELLGETRAYLCLECGKCSSNCPVAVRALSATPRALVARLVSDGVEAVENEYLLRACLSCGQCMERCPSDVDFVRFIAGLRNLAPAESAGSCPHGGMFQSAMRIMARSEKPPDRRAWLEAIVERAKTDGKGAPLRFVVELNHARDFDEEVVFFMGCLPYFDAVFAASSGSLEESPLSPPASGGKTVCSAPSPLAGRAGVGRTGIDMAAIAISTVRLLNAMGTTPVVLADERCCGHDLLWAGDLKNFELLARRNIARLAETKAMTVVTACAECARTLKLDYSRYGNAQFETLHVVELLARTIDAVPWPQPKAAFLPAKDAAAGSGRKGTRVGFQDPCRLGRHLKVFDAPRTVLDSLPEVQRVELPRSREKALCCGVSSWLCCDSVAKQIQVDRLAEAVSTGVDVLATACPKCKIHLSCAARELGRDTKTSAGSDLLQPLLVRDIVELAAAALSQTR